MSIQDYNKEKQAEQFQNFSDRMNTKVIVNSGGRQAGRTYFQSITEGMGSKVAEQLRTDFINGHPNPPSQTVFQFPLPVGSTLNTDRPKILVIGQAPPAQKQTVPYDTTLLYTWLEEIGISKEHAQHIFEWEAVCPVFVGRYENGSGHRTPPHKMMYDHWKACLEEKVITANKIWVLGGVARDFIKLMENMNRSWSANTEFFYSLHPSRRNLHSFRQIKDQLIPDLHNFIYF